MSRIDELKKQYKEFAVCDLDIMKMIVPDQANKYTEMLAKLTKNLIDNDYNNQFGSVQDALRKDLLGNLIDLGIDYNYLETLETQVLYNIYNRVNSIIGRNRVQTFNKFAQLNERKLIEKNDITSYKSFEEVEQAVSLAEIKMVDKELEKQIKKVYEDDTWVSLRPLSLEASMKYGANTKWCTTTESGQYYARYTSRGILIYNINKKTGYKVACFKNIDQAYDNEFSWWDVTDKKIEALDSEAPIAVLEAIRNEIKNSPVPNQILMSEEEQTKLEFYKNGDKVRLNDPFEPSLHISGGLSTYTTGNTIDYNPSTFTTTGTLTTSSNTGLTYYTGNIGMSTTTPNTQLSVRGDMEIDGDVILRSDGEERARLTPDGFRFSATQESLNEDLERRLFADLTREMNGNDRIAADAQQRLDDAVAEQLAEANERVAEKHLSLLENIEMGTLNNDVILKMQALAGIKTTKQQIQELEGEIEQLRARINDEEQEAEQPVLPSKPKLNIWDQIKSLIK